MANPRRTYYANYIDDGDRKQQLSEPIFVNYPSQNLYARVYNKFSHTHLIYGYSCSGIKFASFANEFYESNEVKHPMVRWMSAMEDMFVHASTSSLGVYQYYYGDLPTVTKIFGHWYKCGFAYYPRFATTHEIYFFLQDVDNASNSLRIMQISDADQIWAIAESTKSLIRRIVENSYIMLTCPFWVAEGTLDVDEGIICYELDTIPSNSPYNNRVCFFIIHPDGVFANEGICASPLGGSNAVTPPLLTVYNTTYTYNAQVPEKDTNKSGGISEMGGGTGTFDNTSDNIDIPALPSLSATTSKFVTLYNPTLANLAAIADYLWSQNIFDQLISKIALPLDLIIGLGIVPYDVPTSGSQHPHLGPFDIPINIRVASTQYKEIDCGSLTVSEYWGSALDYSPYTKAKIYLPFIGERQLDVDQIMAKTLHVVYHCDSFSGACVAFIKVNNAVLYQYTGNCMETIPINSQDFSQFYTSIVSLLTKAGIVAATGGFGAATAETTAGTLQGLAVSASTLSSATMNSVMSAKPNIENVGNVSGSAGHMAIQKPYLTLERPRQSLPNDYMHICGYPSNISSQLGALSGFTVVESVHLDGIPATLPELDEINKLLMEGVII